jgi:hypothetical protein
MVGRMNSIKGTLKHIRWDSCTDSELIHAVGGHLEDIYVSINISSL